MIANSFIRKQRIVLLILTLLILGTMVISLGMGASAVSFDRIIPTLFGHGTFKDEFVLFSIRLPRIIITLLAGMALALSGSILQSITRNDLADPGIIGINSGAGVAIAIFFLYFPIEVGSFVYTLPLVAFLGAITTAILIYIFSYSKKEGLQPVRMILVGVGFQMALSGIMVVLISSSDNRKVDFISKWLAGNIWGADWPFIWALLPWLVVLIPFTLYKANRLNILNLSEPVAVGLGISLQKERIILLVVAVALSASAVSVTGGIAFIGLLSPHIAKALVGPRNQLFIPVSVLIGGLLLLFADTIGRSLLSTASLPAGIIVSLIGAPYFIYLLFKK
ncbi:FecCD family ABC transporter permease [Rummeliibacillus pycnus]|uniref:FecCD family ABC transporter permease n=1 Tax=Rummeliibacillus pycnus TaxID=101070 RepID=UPI003D2A627B